MYLFFFYCSGAHRDLTVLTHSFPTRRSADLPMSAQVAVIKGDDRTNALGRAEPVTRTGAATVMDENLREMLAKCCFAEGVMWILAALINTGQGVIHQRHCRPRRALRFALALHVVVCLSSPGDVEKNLVFVIALHTVVAIAFASNRKTCG